MFLLIPSKPPHNVQNLELINPYPQLHPFSYIHNTARFHHISINLLTILIQLTPYKFFELIPIQTNLPLQHTYLKYTF